jgi:hypothetical protein
MRIGGLAAGMFVVGLMTGLAGTAVARDEAASTDCTAVMSEHMAGQDITNMMSMMGGSMMGGSMMGGSMMGELGSPMGPDMMGSGTSSMPGSQHELHHPKASPEASE